MFDCACARVRVRACACARACLCVCEPMKMYMCTKSSTDKFPTEQDFLIKGVD